VDDAHQRQRLGATMAGELPRRARARGVTRLTASVLPGRTALLEWLGRHYRMEDIAFGEDEVSAVYRIGPGSNQAVQGRLPQGRLPQDRAAQDRAAQDRAARARVAPGGAAGERATANRSSR
jgi:hypothetical protein